jgi:hypothetical protein
MANRLASVWLGQRAAAGNAHFQLAKVIEPRRYVARALTRFARRRGRTRLLPALAPHRNRCEERVPLVLSNGHGTLLSIMGYVHHTTMRSKLLNRESRLGRPGRGARRPGGRRLKREKIGVGKHRIDLGAACPLPTRSLHHWQIPNIDAMRPAGLLRREALERLGSTSPPTSTTRSRCLTSSVIYCWWLADRRLIVPDRLASAASRASIAGDAVGPLSGRLSPISILARRDRHLHLPTLLIRSIRGTFRCR